MSMARGYVNAGIPDGLVREIRELIKDEYLGYRNVSEVVKEGTRLLLIVHRLTRALQQTTKRPGTPLEGVSDRA